MKKNAFIATNTRYLIRFLESCRRILLRTLLLSGFCFTTLPVISQNAPHPSFRQYTTDDGLASPEVFHILQDQEGFIWMASDNGVSRFDGYEFQNYGLKDGLRENVIFMMQFDAKGRLWMQAMSGNLYYMEEGVIRPYWHNKVIQDLPDRPDYGKGFIVEGTGKTVHISTLKYGFITIIESGEVLFHKEEGTSYHQVFEKNGVAIYAKCNKPETKADKGFQHNPDRKSRSVSVYFYINGETWYFADLEGADITNYYAEVLNLGESRYLFQLYDKVWYIENGKVQWKTEFKPKIQYARVMNKGQLYLGLYGHGGLGVFKSLEAFRKNEGTIRLPGKTVNHFMEDREGGRWFATHEDGVFYAPADAYMVHDRETGLPDEKVTALAAKNGKELFAGLENGEVWKIETGPGIWSRLPEITGKGAIRDLFFDEQGQQLWAGREKLVYFEKNNWKLMPSGEGSGQGIIANHLVKREGKKGFWVCNGSGFLGIDLPKKTISNVNIKSERTFATQEDYNGRIWIGQTEGLFELRGTVLFKQDSLESTFSLRVEDLALMPDSTLVIATKGGGVVFWKGKQLEKITTNEGLTADMLESVFADEKGNLWAGTLNGLNRISGTFGKRVVKQITFYHGLPSNEINRICVEGDNVWVATNKGLVHFEDKNIIHEAPAPILSSVSVNNDYVDLSKPARLNANENNLSIDFFTINYKMAGQIPYRYRMDHGLWTETKNRTLNFPALSPGERFFEVQSQNEDGTWSESTVFQFAIKPPWWATWWAISGAVLWCLLFVGAIYKYRTGQLKKANKIQLQMAELERSALQAQMNPHFIFNCLNSIQNYILQNEKEAAILYLGSFSKLVRSMLNASVVGKISLKEEIQLLDNYLEMEKLRFKNRFDFEVKSSVGMDVFDLKIPPLLVQPYVENAVLHGITGRKKGGKVSVLFEKEPSFIVVSITDNGGGIKPESIQAESSKSHKSFGMSITRNRLELLSGKKENNAVNARTLTDEKGDICGTQVIIRIGINGEKKF